MAQNEIRAFDKNVDGKDTSFLKYYLNNSTIHGTKYIAESKHWMPRTFWILALTTSFVLCGYVLSLTFIKWQYSPTLGFYKKLAAVQSIPFPTLTVCPLTKVRKSLTRFEHSFRQRYEKVERHGESYNESLYFEALLHACDPQLLKYLDMNESVLESDMDLVVMLQKILYSHDDSMMLCKWRDNMTKCSELFNKILTDQGICFSFNMLDHQQLFNNDTIHKDFEMFTHSKISFNWSLSGGYKDSSSYPWSIISHQYDGLRIILKITDTDMDFVCRGPDQGFNIYWNLPCEVPNQLSRFIFIPIEQDVKMSMKAAMTERSSNLLKYSPEIRQCFLSDERTLNFFKVYTKSNCVIECLTNFTLSTCDCVKFSMPRGSNTKVCNATKLRCVLGAERKFLSIEKGNDQCNCLPSCTEITYEAQLFQTNYDFARMFKSYGYDLSDKPGVKMSRITIYFDDSDFEINENYATSDSIDFIASVGGFLGLFMGFSILSFIELGYYFILWIVIVRKSKKVEARRILMFTEQIKF